MLQFLYKFSYWKELLKVVVPYKFHRGTMMYLSVILFHFLISNCRKKWKADMEFKYVIKVTILLCYTTLFNVLEIDAMSKKICHV